MKQFLCVFAIGVIAGAIANYFEFDTIESVAFIVLCYALTLIYIDYWRR